MKPASLIDFQRRHHWDNLASFFRRVRGTRIAIVLIPCAIALAIWWYYGTLTAGFGLLMRTPQAEPWVPGISLNDHALYTKAASMTAPTSKPAAASPSSNDPKSPSADERAGQTANPGLVAWPWGLALLFGPPILLIGAYYVLRRLVNFDHLRISAELEKAFQESRDGRLRQVGALELALRQVHYTVGKPVNGKKWRTAAKSGSESGLVSFFRKFVRDNLRGAETSTSEYSGSFSESNSTELLETIVAAFRKPQAAVFLAVIDGEIINRHLTDSGSDKWKSFMLMYFLMLDAEEEPSSIVSRIFTYHMSRLRENGAKDFLLQMLWANLLSGATTHLHLHDCDACNTHNGHGCDECKRNTDEPMFGLDYVLVPRNRTEPNARSTVFFDFGEKAFTLQDGIFIEVLKRDYELRLPNRSRRDVRRITFGSMCDKSSSLYVGSTRLLAFDDARTAFHALLECLRKYKTAIGEPQTDAAFAENITSLVEAARVSDSNYNRTSFANMVDKYIARCTQIGSAFFCEGTGVPSAAHAGD